MDKLNYGILSTSSIAPRFIAAVREADAGNIVALSSRTIEKAEEKAKEWGIPKFYGSHEELLNDANVNVIYISSVNSEHYSQAKAALQHGKNVVCEKPCTMKIEETKELFAIAREKKLFLMEAEKMLFLPTLIEVKTRIENGTLGKIYMADMSHSFSSSYNTWMFDPVLGGGPLYSSGIYAIQLLLWLFGDIKKIDGQCSKFDDGIAWQYILSGELENGILFSAKNSTRGILDNTAKIFGEKGWVEIPEYWKARKAIFHIKGCEDEIIEFPCKYELAYEAVHIKECLLAGLHTSPVVTEEITVKGIEALDKVMKGNFNLEK